ARTALKQRHGARGSIRGGSLSENPHKTSNPKRNSAASNHRMTVLPTRKHFNPVVIGGLILYAGSFAVLVRNRNFEPGGALIVLVLFGIIFPALAWLAIVRAVPLSVSCTPTAREMLVLVACIVALSIYLIGGPQWIDQHLPDAWIDSPQIKFFITLAKKLIVFVLIPFGIFRIRVRISALRFRDSTRRIACASWEPFAIGSCSGWSVTGLPIFSRQRRSADPTGQIHRLRVVTWSSTLFCLARDRGWISGGIFLSRARPIAACCLV